MVEIITQPSPNFNSRDPAVPVQFVVLHYTGMASGKAALQRLCDRAAKVSAHYLIEEDGRIFSLVDEAHRAWHAGESFWRGITDMNSASIGIELVNPGHQHGYRAFAERQLVALEGLLDKIVQRHALPAMAYLAHADIAPARKEDPGELFPWQRLAEKGFGLWPETRTPDDYAAVSDPRQSDAEVQQLLRLIGYDCPDSGAYDRRTRHCLIAFQRHYEPANMTGTPERETIARLRALARMIKSST